MDSSLTEAKLFIQGFKQLLENPDNKLIRITTDTQILWRLALFGMNASTCV